MEYGSSVEVNEDDLHDETVLPETNFKTPTSVAEVATGVKIPRRINKREDYLAAVRAEMIEAEIEEAELLLTAMKYREKAL